MTNQNRIKQSKVEMKFIRTWADKPQSKQTCESDEQKHRWSIPRKNFLVKSSEMQSWEIQKENWESQNPNKNPILGWCLVEVWLGLVEIMMFQVCLKPMIEKLKRQRWMSEMERSKSTHKKEFKLFESKFYCLFFAHQHPLSLQSITKNQKKSIILRLNP
jgi:hypothetical protein